MFGMARNTAVPVGSHASNLDEGDAGHDRENLRWADRGKRAGCRLGVDGLHREDCRVRHHRFGHDGDPRETTAELGPCRLPPFRDRDLVRLDPARAQQAADEGVAHAAAADDDEAGHLSTPTSSRDVS